MRTNNYLYYHQSNWVEGRAPARQESLKLTATKTWDEICYYYANIIDYVRVLMSFGAIVLILHWMESTRVLIGATLMISTLLDWVDGPVARYYKQSTLMGCGWDWLADILTQFAMAVWMLVDPVVPGWFRSFTVLFTVVEVSTGLFDFAVSSKGFYPDAGDETPWYAIVEDLLVPKGRYNRLGTFCWLVNTALPISYGLQGPDWLNYLLIPFAFLYSWHECSQFIFIITTWVEVDCKQHCGVELMRHCAPSEKEFIEQCLRETEDIAAKDHRDVVFWYNLFVGGQWRPEFQHKEEMERLVNNLMAEFYREKRYLRTCGFITSPRHGTASKAQAWHYDYTPGTSNIFIPISQLTHKNATQFIRGTRPGPLPASEFFPPPHVLLDDEKLDSIEVSQLLAKPFSILKLWPSIMHRGIDNGEDYDRVMFFISSDSEPFKPIEETFVVQTSNMHEGDIGVKGERY